MVLEKRHPVHYFVDIYLQCSVVHTTSKNNDKKTELQQGIIDIYHIYNSLVTASKFFWGLYVENN